MSVACFCEAPASGSCPCLSGLVMIGLHHLEKFDDVLPAPNVKWTCPFSLSTLNDIAGGPSDPRDKRLLSTHEKF